MMTWSVLSHLALWLSVAFLALVAAEILRRVTDIHEQWVYGSAPERGLAIGSRAPAINAADLRSGRRFRTDTYLKGDILLLFVSSRCSSCKALLSGLRQTPGNVVATIVTCIDGAPDCVRILDGIPVSKETYLIEDEASKIRRRYKVGGAPTAVLVGPGHRVRGYGHPTTVQDLEKFVNAATARTEVLITTGTIAERATKVG